MIKVSMVPPQMISQIWPSVEGYLAKASEYTNGRYEVQDILDTITDYGYYLWVAFDDAVIKGAVVTNIVAYPRRKVLCMQFCGGVELAQWKDPMLQILQSFAFDAGCDGIEATARPGWAKIFKNDGYKPSWQTFELPAAKAGLGVHNG